ncbi:MAG: hypothetical protein WB048_23310, partial [Pseudolabrys sp.]
LTQTERNMREMHDVLRREIRAVAFDQYGTIVDMQTGLTEAVAPFLKHPKLGQHTHEVLTTLLGYTSDEVIE